MRMDPVISALISNFGAKALDVIFDEKGYIKEISQILTPKQQELLKRAAQGDRLPHRNNIW